MQSPAPSIPAIPVTPVVETTAAERTRDISMIDVTVAAFGLTGVIMSAALIAGLLAGAGYVWFRSRRPVSTIEARGGNANFLRGDGRRALGQRVAPATTAGPFNDRRYCVTACCRASAIR